ncbi:MAG: hypothetical protein M3437_13505 [Chloroflexota bacterium]|nr:hypothetical protein [Chloroflexota bacterium]MDQ5866140.1 hypothetical protein [Chloroflexota bacterium]
MDRLRHFIKRNGNGGGKGNGHASQGNGASSEPLPPPAKQGGHGDHWGCIFRAVEQDRMLALIQDVVANDSRPDGFQAPGGGAAYHSSSSPVRMCVLLSGGTLESAYPEALPGSAWPVVVHEVIPWANGIEGQITGDCHGASISFFDTRFYANRNKYRVGEQHTFRMSAFAYTVSRASDAEVEIGTGTKVSLKGARAYMPANIGANPDADIDEYWFHSPLESAASEAEFAGRRLHALPITMAIPGDFEMGLVLYAAGHTLDLNTNLATPEELDLEGYLWLQGYMADL